MESYKYNSLNPSKQVISLKRPRKNNIYTSRTLSFAFTLSGEISKNENFPKQVSEEQSGSERSVLTFSNGLSLHTTDQASSLAIGGESMYRYRGYNVAIGSESSHSSYFRQFAGNPSGSSQRLRHPGYIEHNNRLRSYSRWTHRNPDPITLTKAGFFYTNKGDLVRCYQCGIGLKDLSDGDGPLKEHRILQAHDPELNRQRQLNGFEDHARCFACDGGLRRWDKEDDPWTEHCRWFPACPFAKEKKGDEFTALVQVAVVLENKKHHGKKISV